MGWGFQMKKQQALAKALVAVLNREPPSQQHKAVERVRATLFGIDRGYYEAVLYSAASDAEFSTGDLRALLAERDRLAAELAEMLVLVDNAEQNHVDALDWLLLPGEAVEERELAKRIKHWIVSRHALSAAPRADEAGEEKDNGNL